MKSTKLITKQDLFELYTDGLITEENYKKSLKDIDQKEKKLKGGSDEKGN